MRVDDIPIFGAKILVPQKREDARGSFTRLWCRDALREAGIAGDFVQANIAGTKRAGTIRGLHYQEEPDAEDKLIRCTRGSIFDVIVDLRVDSPTYLEWYGTEISSGATAFLFAPRGCAHGYQTLVDDSAVEYFVTSPYSPDKERGIRWDDRRFSINWPKSSPTLSAKDEGWRDFSPDDLSKSSS